MSTSPKTFVVESHGASGINEFWNNRLVDKVCDAITMAIPPEFEGPGGTYSPEDLYAMSLMNCYLATFKYIAEKSKLNYVAIKGKATLFVDKGLEKAPWMERVEVQISLTGCPQKERALALMEKTKSHCMIINSVKTVVNFEFLVD
ncbi:MAG: OsmC family protein [Bacteriovorax sp.]|nr:OsmC family protein [Bacteriovorax sp.]